MITAAIRRRRAAMGAAEHWAHKGGVRLFLREKFVGTPAIMFVHGSSMASQPTFDFTVPGRPDSSVSHLTTRNAAR